MKTIKSHILFLIKSKTLFKYFVFRLRNASFPKIKTIDDQNKVANMLFNYRYDCTKPKTFNEYLGWLKFNYFNPLWCECADKLGGKRFLKQIGLEQYIPKTISIYNSIEEIDLKLLPEKFVLKTNNDCGTVFKCDKKKSDFGVIFEKLSISLKSNYSENGEWVYSNIKPVVFSEELLGDSVDEDLIDYKFFVYRGAYKWGFCALNRHKDCNFFVFEGDFNIQNVNYIYINYKKNKPKKPIQFSKMVELAEYIGSFFDFVRVDMYLINGEIKIGELTFFSMSGLGLFTKKSYDLKYGSYFSNIFKE